MSPVFLSIRSGLLNLMLGSVLTTTLCLPCVPQTTKSQAIPKPFASFQKKLLNSKTFSVKIGSYYTIGLGTYLYLKGDHKIRLRTFLPKATLSAFCDGKMITVWNESHPDLFFRKVVDTDTSPLMQTIVQANAPCPMAGLLFSRYKGGRQLLQSISSGHQTVNAKSRTFTYTWKTEGEADHQRLEFRFDREGNPEFVEMERGREEGKFSGNENYNHFEFGTALKSDLFAYPLTKKGQRVLSVKQLIEDTSDLRKTENVDSESTFLIPGESSKKKGAIKKSTGMF
ncbi:MAG: hypothetical protein H7308_08745 [Chthonomonadaceae bacterium]|nr:hypothetical protein [Chthonomonadaceae bacterium]